MINDNRLYQLLQVLPLTIVLGVNLDFSRYRYFYQLTDELKNRETFVNLYLKDKIDILVYPARYGQDIYVKLSDGGYEKVQDIDKVFDVYKNSIKTLIIPGHCLNNDFLFEIPGRWDLDYELTFKNSLFQIIFVESFPYGKENFVKLLNEAVQKYPYYVVKKVLYYKAVKTGATDTTSLDDAINKAASKISKYILDIRIFEGKENDDKDRKISYDFSAQFKWKKLKEVEAVKRAFESMFEYDYSIESTRLLCVGENEKPGVLSEQSFQKAADFEKVKNAEDIEKVIVANYLAILSDNKESIAKLAEVLYEEYLRGFLSVEKIDFGEMPNQVICSIKRDYKFKRKKSCPDTSVEYMILCNKEGYIVKLKKCVNKIIEERVHLKLKKDIEQKIKECEAKYL